MDERSERIARRFELPMLVAALLVIPLLVIEQSGRGAPWDTIAHVLNWGTWLAFATEIAVMLAVVPDRRRWLREHPLEVVVTLISPPAMPAALAGARVLRLLRILRLLRLASLGRRIFTLEGVRYAALLAFVAMLGGGTAYAGVEQGRSEWDGIWWAATAMTTVDFGDPAPQTDAGRAIALGLILVGIGFGSLLIGAIAERFVMREMSEEIEEIEWTEERVLSELRQLGERLARIEQGLSRRDAG